MELFAADGHDAGGCERVTGKSGMRPLTIEQELRRVPQPPLYQPIGPQVAQFHVLSYPNSQIAVAAEVTDTTVAKTLPWLATVAPL